MSEVSRGAIWLEVSEDGITRVQAVADPGTPAEHYVTELLGAWIDVAVDKRRGVDITGDLSDALRSRLNPAEGDGV